MVATFAADIIPNITTRKAVPFDLGSESGYVFISQALPNIIPAREKVNEN
jgi:hypothetical protein